MLACAFMMTDSHGNDDDFDQVWINVESTIDELDQMNYIPFYSLLINVKMETETAAVACLYLHYTYQIKAKWLFVYVGSLKGVVRS